MSKKQRSFAYGYSMVANWWCTYGIMNFYVTVSASYYRDSVAALHGFDGNTVLAWTTWSAIIVSILFLFLPKLMGRFGAKKVMIVGAFANAVTYALIPFSPNALTMTILVGLLTLWGGLYCNITVPVMVSKWFPRKKGTVLGIATASSILASSIMLPIFSRILSTKGVTTAMLVFALIHAVYGVICIFWVKETPEELGLMPDNQPMTEEEKQRLVAAASQKSEWTYKQALKSPRMWCISVGWALEMNGMVGLMQVLVSFMMGNGLELATVTAVASAGGILAIVGSILSGVLDTKFNTRIVSVIVVCIHCASYFIFGLAAALPAMFMVGAYLLIQFVAGAVNNLPLSHLISIYGPKNTAIFGTLCTFILSFRFFGQMIDSKVYAATGSYNGAFIIFGVMAVVAIILIWLGGKSYIEPPKAAESSN